MKDLYAGKFVDADQIQFGSSEVAAGKPVQQIDQLDLAKQIMLEPEHDFVVFRKTR